LGTESLANAASAALGYVISTFSWVFVLASFGFLAFSVMLAAKANTRDAAQVAMEYSYFHWAFHPWAMYAVLGLALAYFTFRNAMPSLISTAFYPILGERVNGPIGKTIDILAIFATLFGSATSLGLELAPIGR
jgi:glycine betaine transporter